MNKTFAATMFLAVAALTAPALAHTKVQTTSIADGARLERAPANITLTFTRATGLTGVALANVRGAPVPMTYRPPANFGRSFTIMLPPVPPGEYKLSWRAIARDGHAVPDAVTFTVVGN